MRSLTMMARLVLIAGSVLVLASCQNRPAPPHESTADKAAEVVIGTTHALASAVFDTTRTINVFVPMGYAAHDEPLPVLYLVDGGAEQDFVPLAGLAALATLTGQYREFILVGVQTEHRYYELTAPSDLPYDLQQIRKNGGAEHFRRHLLTEVKPFIESRYRTSGEDAIIGESLAGLFICETLLREPRGFDHYIAVSPSLWWHDMGLSREAATLLQAADFPADRSLYLTLASEGGTMVEGMQRLVSALENHARADLRWWYEPRPDEEHHTIYHPAALQALRLVFAVD